MKPTKEQIEISLASLRAAKRSDHAWGAITTAEARALLDYIEALRRALDSAQAELIDAKENHARDVCHTREVDCNYMGQVAGTRVTDSGAVSTNAMLLDDLAEAGRFRKVAEYGRMVVGYWPENDPQRKGAKSP